MQSKLAIVAKQRGPGIISNPKKKSQTRIPASTPKPGSCVSPTAPIIKIEFPKTTSSQANQPYLKFISSTVLSKLPESSSWVYVPTRRTDQIFLLAQRRENAAHAALVIEGRLWDGTWRA
ncbi:hypothetical protein FOYG_16575 [Fusarium oxysporum NRRL 32931]|uniref:Uncharacterized protein n=1 Tax=Fusarium oxysporum NRRL 32931 TaxID=660029 RepID=W9HI49_FUSOX|nr:hypothetical protein FOYG_16575 [Fusarium oxysporum NRRL 32931]